MVAHSPKNIRGPHVGWCPWARVHGPHGPHGLHPIPKNTTTCCFCFPDLLNPVWSWNTEVVKTICFTLCSSHHIKRLMLFHTFWSQSRSCLVPKLNENTSCTVDHLQHLGTTLRLLYLLELTCTVLGEPTLWQLLWRRYGVD